MNDTSLSSRRAKRGWIILAAILMIVANSPVLSANSAADKNLEPPMIAQPAQQDNHRVHHDHHDHLHHRQQSQPGANTILPVGSCDSMHPLLSSMVTSTRHLRDQCSQLRMSQDDKDHSTVYSDGSQLLYRRLAEMHAQMQERAEKAMLAVERVSLRQSSMCAKMRDAEEKIKKLEADGAFGFARR